MNPLFYISIAATVLSAAGILFIPGVLLSLALTISLFAGMCAGVVGMIVFREGAK